MHCVFPSRLTPTGRLRLRTRNITWEVHAGSACSPNTYGQEELSVQDLLGKELKSEAGDLPSARESASVHVHCTAVTAAKGPR